MVTAGGRFSGWREMSTLSWCVGTLVLLYAIGGGTFSYLEREKELETYRRNRQLFEHMRDLYEFEKCEEEPFRSMEFCQKQKEFNEMLQTHLNKHGTEIVDHKKWTFTGSSFYITTLVTTLGYGNLHPLTWEGQLFTVLFGLLGIPAMGYVLSHIGRFVVDVCMPILDNKLGHLLDSRSRQICLLSGIMVSMILLGGVLFSTMEGWTFLQACYFSACTLMTVGFGDLLPGQHPLSKLVTVLFIFCGLGVAATFMALLQLHVELRGEHFAKHVNSWYDAVAGECTFSDKEVGSGNSQSPGSSSGARF